MFHSIHSGLLDSSECQFGSIRLTRGSDEFSGKVETCVNGVFGAICDSSATVQDATVICRQLFGGNKSNSNILYYCDTSINLIWWL